MVDAYCRKFASEIGISTIKQVDSVNEAFAIGSCGSNHIGEPGSKVGYYEFGAM